MYYRQVGNLPLSAMTMFTKGDVKFAAEKLRVEYPEFKFEPDAKFMGYEGYDGGVKRYRYNQKEYDWEFDGWVSDQMLREICWGRPIVLQENSCDDE